MRVANRIIGPALLVMVQIVYAQNQPLPQAPQLSVGENTKLSAGALFTFGYSGDYGNAIPSNHGLTWGLDGNLAGYYYNPNFLSFNVTPYYNQSRAELQLSILNRSKRNRLDRERKSSPAAIFRARSAITMTAIPAGPLAWWSAEFHHGGQRSGIWCQLERAISRHAHSLRRIFARQRQRHDLWHQRGNEFQHATVQRALKL